MMVFNFILKVSRNVTAQHNNPEAENVILKNKFRLTLSYYNSQSPYT